MKIGSISPLERSRSNYVKYAGNSWDSYDKGAAIKEDTVYRFSGQTRA